MSGPAPTPIEVTTRQRAILERLVRRQTTPQRLVWRASIILGAAGPPGAKNEHLAQRLHLSRGTVVLWRRRWAAAQPALAGIEAAGGDDRELTDHVLRLLVDEPRPGAPGVFTPEQIVAIVALACEVPAGSERPVSHWTPRELADEAVKRGIVERISARSVGRFLKAGRPEAPPEQILVER